MNEIVIISLLSIISLNLLGIKEHLSRSNIKLNEIIEKLKEE